MALSLPKFGDTLIEQTKARQPKQSCLWPAPYNDNTPQAAFKFLTECWWTWDETSGEIGLVPRKEYIEAACYEWHQAFEKRQALLIAKSRRLLISWLCRGLETWQMGLQRGESLIVDQVYENAAEHLWRVHFSLSQLRERRPEIKLAPHRYLGSADVKRIDDVVLPNGSLMTQGHQRAGSQQGKGKTIVSLEELSKYDSPADFWGQALIVTQGSATGKGGWVCGIANASANKGWDEIKEGANAREMLGLE